ncbi:RING finger protein 145 isoform X1 [Xenopus laevis]|uniref:RING finger protein 145 n=1 Tax=Xenopus laevis TaxID=8355 RepID=A0A8J0TF46_XENLA|nr:RING finger protein 145 isoform X1 [Xenopus laevis]
MSRLEDIANVVLRLPSIVVLDLLYRWDFQAFTELSRPTYETNFFKSKHLWNIYYLAHFLCAVLLLLPLRYLVNIYLYLLTALLLYVAHRTTRDSIQQEMDSDFPGALYDDPNALTRIITALTGLVIVATLCSLLLKTRNAWLFCSPVLPLLGRIVGLPLQVLPPLNNVSIFLTVLGSLFYLLSNLGVLLNLFRKVYQEVVQVQEFDRLVTLGMQLWAHLAVPLLFLVFWLVSFSFHIVSFLSSKPGALGQQGLIFIFLNSAAECCGTPYCLIGLTFTVSYLALGMLNFCKFYLLGFDAFRNGNVMHRGVTEGVTLMLLALQTGLLDLQVLQRTFLLSIILFIVVTSTLQSMIEIADPIVLALGATRNRSLWKHLRGVSMCLFLLVFPCFMAYKISQFFHMDFWLLILVSSCMLTSLQVLGTLFIYALFMVELFHDNQVEKIDEIIYYVNAVSRVLEFLVAVCVVAYGTWESLFGEWSWMGVSVIIVHSYFNVWLRAQSGWKSFLLRREAAKKINSMPRATKEQLMAHNDVCPICFQDMSDAIITPCSHIFHGECLRKWLYIQDTCPICHQQVNPLVEELGEDKREEDEEEEAADEPMWEEATAHRYRRNHCNADSEEEELQESGLDAANGEGGGNKCNADRGSEEVELQESGLDAANGEGGGNKCNADRGSEEVELQESGLGAANEEGGNKCNAGPQREEVELQESGLDAANVEGGIKCNAEHQREEVELQESGLGAASGEGGNKCNAEHQREEVELQESGLDAANVEGGIKCNAEHQREEVEEEDGGENSAQGEEWHLEGEGHLEVTEGGK